MLIGLPPYYSSDHAEMYQRILHERLQLPSNMRGITRDFLTKVYLVTHCQMLERIPERRLGGGKLGTEEVKRHPYFEVTKYQAYQQGVSWDKVYECEYDAPFVPKVVPFNHNAQDGTLDFRNIDPTFSAAPISRSLRREAGEPVTGLTLGTELGSRPGEDWDGYEQVFDGFTYEPPRDLDESSCI